MELRFYRAIYHWHTTTTTNNNNTIIIIVHRESIVFLIEHYISGGNGWYRIISNESTKSLSIKGEYTLRAAVRLINAIYVFLMIVRAKKN
jgi:hypothetical protein